MRMVRLEGAGRVSVVEAPEPVPGPGEVLVETAVSALCGSELGGYRGKGQKSGNSGHEAAGVVVGLGQGVAGLRQGQRVGASAVAGCGRCRHCQAGRYTWCPDRRTYLNMHAERFLAAAAACHPLPEDLPWDVGVLVSGDGLGVPYHSSTRIAGPEVRKVAVFGVGPIGLGSVLLQSHLGRQVLAVDVSEPRLRRACALGAERALDPREGDPVARIREFTGGEGADACIEAAGRPETLKQCFAAVRPGGTVVINGEQPAVELSPSQDFIRRDIAAVGAWYYHFSEFGAMVELCRAGLRAAELVSHRFPLGRAAEAFREFAAGGTAKVLLLCGG